MVKTWKFGALLSALAIGAATHAAEPDAGINRQLTDLEAEIQALEARQARLWASIGERPGVMQAGHSEEGPTFYGLQTDVNSGAPMAPAASEPGDDVPTETAPNQSNAVSEPANPTPPAPAASGAMNAAPSGFKIYPFCEECTPDGKPKYPTVRLTGMFQLDAGWIDQDDLNRDTVGDIQDGSDFRRVRFGAVGNVTEDVSYQVEFDFAQSQPRFADLWMDFDTHGDLGHLRIGRFRQPFGMTAMTGIRELPFLERPLPFALMPFRQTGIMAYNTDFDEHMTWAVSGYRYLSDNFGNVYGDNGGSGTAVRTTFLPYYFNDGQELIHIGFDYSFNDPAREIVQYQFQPEFFLGQNPNLGPAGLDYLPIVNLPPFVNTGPMPTETTNLFNIEAAGAFGRLYLQSEMTWAVVDRYNGSQETFPGAYAEARYVLTGEKLPYNKQQGVFGRIVPDDPFRFCAGGLGAWEIAGRWSWIDLNAPNLTGPGRELTDLTFGVNWYVNKFTKFQFNYIHAMLDDPTLGESDANIFATRAQLDF